MRDDLPKLDRTAHSGSFSFECLPAVCFVFSSVQDSPLYPPRMWIGKPEKLPVGPGVAPPVSGETLYLLKLHSLTSLVRGECQTIYFGFIPGYLDGDQLYEERITEL